LPGRKSFAHAASAVDGLIEAVRAQLDVPSLGKLAVEQNRVLAVLERPAILARHLSGLFLAVVFRLDNSPGPLKSPQVAADVACRRGWFRHWRSLLPLFLAGRGLRLELARLGLRLRFRGRPCTRRLAIIVGVFLDGPTRHRSALRAVLGN